MIVLVADARAQWAELDRRIAAFDAEFVRWVKENEEARRLTTIPGIGAIVASALSPPSVGRKASTAAAISPHGLVSVPTAVHHRRQAEAARYQQARQQVSAPTADPRSARGAALCGRARHAARPMGESSLSRAHRNVAIVAFANKLARIAWAVLRRGERLPRQDCRWRRRAWSIRAEASIGQQVFARG